ncbi:MAG: hypothetical protein EPO21_18355, partial [Chloroflexota bacterium]
MKVQFMPSADLMVTHVDKMLDTLHSAIGLPREQTIKEPPLIECEGCLARVNSDPSLGATYLQLLARRPLAEAERPNSQPVGDYITAYMRYQGNRPILSHCTPLIAEHREE